jgi:hypothetical protein
MQSASNQATSPNCFSVSRNGVPQLEQTGTISTGSFFHSPGRSILHLLPRSCVWRGVIRTSRQSVLRTRYVRNDLDPLSGFSYVYRSHSCHSARLKRTNRKTFHLVTDGNTRRVASASLMPSGTQRIQTNFPLPSIDSNHSDLCGLLCSGDRGLRIRNAKASFLRTSHSSFRLDSCR